MLFSRRSTPETRIKRNDITMGEKMAHQAPPARATRYIPHHTQKSPK
jgi:hypothetical protein